MTLNERERFIFHMCAAMVLSTTEKYSNKPFNIKRIQTLVLTNRARHLSKSDVHKLTDDIKEEVLLGGTFYEELIHALVDDLDDVLDMEDGK